MEFISADIPQPLGQRGLGFRREEVMEKIENRRRRDIQGKEVTCTEACRGSGRRAGMRTWAW